MPAILSVQNLNKTYAGDFVALRDVSLEIERGEIFALLGPNGAGKTTLINIICGIVNPTSGTALVNGHDISTDFRRTRALVGLVPQELPVDSFATVRQTAAFSRGLFGKPADPAHVEKVLRSLSLWDKRDTKIIALSGGMKRRVLIAKALAHEPELLFLDEPTAGVDVELRQDMWKVVSQLRDDGVTVILTTHYIEEAEEMADRVGVINHGEIILVQEKHRLMRELGKKQLTLSLNAPLGELPPGLGSFALELAAGGNELVYTYDSSETRPGIPGLLGALQEAGMDPCQIEFTFGADLRYLGQQSELSIELPGDPRKNHDPDRMREQFEKEYEAQYGLKLSDMSVELVSWRVTAKGSIPDRAPGGTGSASARPEPRHRTVHLRTGAREVPVYDRTDLVEGDSIDGPLIIEERETTIFILPGWMAELHPNGSIVADKKKDN